MGIILFLQIEGMLCLMMYSKSPGIILKKNKIFIDSNFISRFGGTFKILWSFTEATITDGCRPSEHINVNLSMNEADPGVPKHYGSLHCRNQIFIERF